MTRTNVLIQTSFALSNGTTITGTGITPEGLFQNEFVYDYVLAQGYTGKSPDLIDFTSDWTFARYGMKAQNQTKVFNRMATTVWGNEGFERPNRNWQKTTSKCFDKNSKFFWKNNHILP